MGAGEVRPLLNVVGAMYLVTFLGFVAGYRKVLHPDTFQAMQVINGFVINFCIPALGFSVLSKLSFDNASTFAFAGIYTTWMAMGFVACGIALAATLPKNSPLVPFLARCGVSPSASGGMGLLRVFLGVVMVFSMPNTLALGTPVFEAMYGEVGVSSMVIMLYPQLVIQVPIFLILSEIITERKPSAKLTCGRPNSPSPSPTTTTGACVAMHQQPPACPDPPSTHTSQPMRERDQLRQRGASAGDLVGGAAEQSTPEEAGGHHTVQGQGVARNRASATVMRILWRLVKNPIIAFTVLGAVWGATGQPLPELLDVASGMLSRIVFGACNFTLGIFVAHSYATHGTLFTISKRLALTVLFTRHFVAPALGLLTCYALGITGDRREMFVLSCALPQAISTFSVSVQYNIYPDIFTSCITLGTLMTFPALLFWLAVVKL